MGGGGDGQDRGRERKQRGGTWIRLWHPFHTPPDVAGAQSPNVAGEGSASPPAPLSHKHQRDKVRVDIDPPRLDKGDKWRVLR